MHNNLLDEWYNALSLFNWKTAQINDPYFRNLDKIRDEIANFFPHEDFSGSLQDNHDNWLAHLLFDKNPNSIFVINELAELLRFYRSLPNKELLQFKNGDGVINQKRFKETLFELQVNYLLQNVGLKPEIGHKYVEGNNKKEIDLLLDFNGRTLNVEVSRYSDGFKEEFLKLGTDIIWTIGRTQIKRSITLDEVFSGYLAFKKKTETSITSNRNVFHDGLKAFLHGYRSVKNNTINLPEKKESSQYVFHIEPAFNNAYDKTYDALLEKYPAYIKFQLSAEPGSYNGTIKLFAQVHETVEEANKRLLKKIRKKIDQHKNCPYDLLIVIAIEQHFTSFYKDRASPITLERIDKSAIHKLLKGRATLLLIFKSVQETGISYQRMLLGRHHEGNDALFEKIKEIYLPIRYLA